MSGGERRADRPPAAPAVRGCRRRGAAGQRGAVTALRDRDPRTDPHRRRVVSGPRGRPLREYCVQISWESSRNHKLNKIRKHCKKVTQKSLESVRISEYCVKLKQSDLNNYHFSWESFRNLGNQESCVQKCTEWATPRMNVLQQSMHLPARLQQTGAMWYDSAS